MSTDVTDAELPLRWEQLVGEAVTSSGRQAKVIISCSVRVAKEFSKLDPSLEKHKLNASSLSRMCSGRGLRRPRFEKLMVLKLALLHLDEPPGSIRDDARREEMLAEAKAFAKKIWDVATKPRGANNIHHVMSAQYARTVELFGAYGKSLLAQVGKSDGGEIGAKLALLHQLGGNSDDARYWSRQAQSIDPGYSPASSQLELFSRARLYAAEYHCASKVSIVRMYLEHAADSGDGVAAFRLGIMAEVEEDPENAMKWYRAAEALGYSGGGLRMEGLK